MTMIHIARSFKVTFSIQHPDIDPAEITAALALAPRGTARTGEPRKNSKGDPLPGVCKISYWSYEVDAEGAMELGAVLEAFVEHLTPHKHFFRRMVDEGGSVELFCGIWAAGNWDEILSHQLMWHLANLRIDLRLDVYPKKEGGDAS